MKSQLRKMIPATLLLQRLPERCSNFVLLTFDDGPTPGVTELAMDKLEQYNTSALFFMVGKFVEKHPELAKSVVERGHQIGNHSFNHAPATHNISREIDLCQQAITEATGTVCKYYRHPEGSINPSSLLLPRMKNLQSVYWSCDPLDWDCKTEADGVEAAHRLLDNVIPGDIILLHDFASPTLALLDIVLPELADRNLLPPSGGLL
ncbi:polysaccharide deacetylase family protein [bacterium]|jgi:peptidoglycan/xylan/chitin deacetylase (PgdA/CDA1 family)|nr:polysaccharide deacetylase family protein [bacterium]